MLTLWDRITSASWCFTAVPSLTALYVCTDGQCFKREENAITHAVEIRNQKTDYFYFPKVNYNTAVAIVYAESTQNVIDALNGSTDPVLVELANQCIDFWNGEYRITSKTNALQLVKDAGLSPENEIIVITSMLYREDDTNIIDAINTRILQLTP